MKRMTEKQLERAHDEINALRVSDEDREMLHEMLEARDDFVEVHGRLPTNEEFIPWYRNYMDAKLRRFIAAVEKTGCRVIEAGGEIKIVPQGMRQ